MSDQFSLQFKGWETPLNPHPRCCLLTLTLLTAAFDSFSPYEDFNFSFNMPAVVMCRTVAIACNGGSELRGLEGKVRVFWGRQAGQYERSSHWRFPTEFTVQITDTLFIVTVLWVAGAQTFEPCESGGQTEFIAQFMGSVGERLELPVLTFSLNLPDARMHADTHS